MRSIAHGQPRPSNVPSLDFRNANALWGSVVAETLVRCGVTKVVVSPGSRSTPLAFAFARHPGIEAIPVLDERSASFFALGMAKRDLRPVALLCTSGSAGAHYFPAVIEAHEAGVPLLVITADRPPEMRGCASGQTIEQHRLYGAYATFYHELAVPRAQPSDPALPAPDDRACGGADARAACGSRAHLNAPFRDPLVPSEDSGATDAFGSAIDWDGFFAHLAPPASRCSPSPGSPRFPMPCTGPSWPAPRSPVIPPATLLPGWHDRAKTRMARARGRPFARAQSCRGRAAHGDAL